VERPLGRLRELLVVLPLVVQLPERPVHLVKWQLVLLGEQALLAAWQMV
jgi:hypothetical protein